MGRHLRDSPPLDAHPPISSASLIASRTMPRSASRLPWPSPRPTRNRRHPPHRPPERPRRARTANRSDATGPVQGVRTDCRPAAPAGSVKLARLTPPRSETTVSFQRTPPSPTPGPGRSISPNSSAPPTPPRHLRYTRLPTTVRFAKNSAPRLRIIRQPTDQSITYSPNTAVSVKYISHLSRSVARHNFLHRLFSISRR